MQKIRDFIRRRRRAAITVISIVIGLAACIVLIGFIPFSSKILTSKVELLLRESVSGNCEMGGLKVILWKGIIINKMRYSSKDTLRDGPKITCEIPRVTVSYFLFPLFFKHLIINTIVFEKPIVEVVSPPDVGKVKKKKSGEFSAAALKQTLSSLPYTVLVRKIAIEDGRITLKRNIQPIVCGKGIDMTISAGFDHGVSLTGKLNASSLTFSENIPFTGCKGSFKGTTTELAISDFRAGFHGGELTLNGSIDPATGNLKFCTLALNDMKLEDWYRISAGGNGELTGVVNGYLALEKSILQVDSLKGKGWIKARSVATQGTPMHKNLVVRLVVPKLETLKFHTVQTDLIIQKGKILTNKFSGKGDPLDFTANGWFGMDGRLLERIEGVFSADFSTGLPPIVRNSLLPVDKEPDKRAFKCTVQGTLSNPQLEIDQRIVNRAMDNIFDAIGNLFKR
jgi:hypothetical protein